MWERGVFQDYPDLELIAGEIIDMPSDGPRTISWNAALNLWLARHLPDGVVLVPDKTLVLGDDIGAPKPDFFIYPRGVALTGLRGGDTLLVVEISDTTIAWDRDVKVPPTKRVACGSIGGSNGRRARSSSTSSARTGRMAHRRSSRSTGPSKRCSYPAGIAARAAHAPTAPGSSPDRKYARSQTISSMPFLSVPFANANIAHIRARYFRPVGATSPAGVLSGADGRAPEPMSS